MRLRISLRALVLVLRALAAAGLARSVAEPLHAQFPSLYVNATECTLAALLYATLSIILLRFGYTMALYFTVMP